MSIPTTKITKSITLRAGEPFNLPDGAVILYASDVQGLSSTCDNLPESALLKCYQFHWATDGDGDQNPWDSEDIVFYGLSINGTYQEFSTLISGQGDQQNIIRNQIIKDFPIITNAQTSQSIDNERQDRTISFQTIDAVGSNLFLVAGVQGFGGKGVKSVYLKAQEVTC